MIDYEYMILDYQETESDDCTHCEHKKDCRNQCMQIVYGRPIEEIYPFLFRNAGKTF